MQIQMKLFDLNHSQTEIPSALLASEKTWVDGLFKQVPPTTDKLTSFEELKMAITNLVPAPSALDGFIADKMTLEQFKLILTEYAPDGLTEAEAMPAAVFKLTDEAHKFVGRIMSDELGTDNHQKAHHRLYRNILIELSLPRFPQDYLTLVNIESLEAVNIYHFLSKRAPVLDFYLGALAYSELSIPVAFHPYTLACRRLGIEASEYFTEHVKVDVYHQRLAFQALEHLHKKGAVNLEKVLTGAKLAKLVADKTFQAALRKVFDVKEAVNG